MVKTQIQIPELLYKEAKRIAKEREISFAEVVRRGIENIIPLYPPIESKEWELPEPVSGFRPNLRTEDLKEIARADEEARLVDQIAAPPLQ